MKGISFSVSIPLKYGLCEDKHVLIIGGRCNAEYYYTSEMLDFV